MAGFLAQRLWRRRTSRSVDERIAEASRRIRVHLDTESVIRTTAKEIERALEVERVSAWQPNGASEPRNVYRTSDADPTDLRPLVLRAVQRGRIVRREATLAVPITTQRSGVLGVVCFDSDDWTDEQDRFVQALGREAAFALETAHLYERAVAEKEKSEAILTQIGEGIVVTGAHGRILECNQAAESVIGQSCARGRGRTCEEILGLALGERELDCSDGCALLREQDSGAESTAGREVWRIRPDGRRQPLLVNVAPIRNAEGVVTEVVHALRDITRLKEADEAKTLFLATASHELRTPLTVIQGFSQLLNEAKESTPDERKVALEAMESRAKQLNKIVDRLLLSSRIEAGRARVNCEPVDVRALLAERCEALATSLGRDVVADIDDNLPAAHADREAVITIIDHLLDNAVKYSPDGGRVELRASADDSRIWIAVVDHGIGMDAVDVEKCFDKFWQAESSDVRRFGGTGIGLYIVRSLIEAMGGDVAVASVPGEGSAFTFSLVREDASWQSGTSAIIGAPRPGVGDPSVIREFMRQIGVPGRKSR